MAGFPRRASRRRLHLFAAVAIASAGMLSGAPDAVACSCVAPQSMAAYAAEPRTSVLTGVPGALGERGVPVRVTRWFKGPGAEAIVWLSARSFGPQSAACQRMPPTVGQELILVLWMPEDGSDPHGGICTPTAALASPEGQAMFQDSMRTFGQGAAAPSPVPETSSPSPNTAASPVAGGGGEPASGGPDPVLVMSVIAAVALMLAIVLAAGLAVRRRRGRSA
jgi:hypothetical protein